MWGGCGGDGLHTMWFAGQFAKLRVTSSWIRDCAAESVKNAAIANVTGGRVCDIGQTAVCRSLWKASEADDSGDGRPASLRLEKTVAPSPCATSHKREEDSVCASVIPDARLQQSFEGGT